MDYIVSKNKWDSRGHVPFTAWIPHVLHAACHISTAVYFFPVPMHLFPIQPDKDYSKLQFFKRISLSIIVEFLFFITIIIYIYISVAWQFIPFWVELGINAEGWGKSSGGRWKLQRRCGKHHEAQVVSMQGMTRAL